MAIGRRCREHRDQLRWPTLRVYEEGLFRHKESRTLILDELIQNTPMVKARLVATLCSDWSALHIRMAPFHSTSGVPHTNRNLARRSLAKLLSWTSTS